MFTSTDSQTVTQNKKQLYSILKKTLIQIFVINTSLYKKKS